VAKVSWWLDPLCQTKGATSRRPSRVIAGSDPGGAVVCWARRVRRRRRSTADPERVRGGDHPSAGYVTTADHPVRTAVNSSSRTSARPRAAIAIEGLASYPGGDVPLLKDVKGGAVEMAAVSSAVWGTQGVNCFDALQALGLITRYDLEQQVIDGPIGESMLGCTAAAGVHGLAIHGRPAQAAGRQGGADLAGHLQGQEDPHARLERAADRHQRPRR
jgi:hypothetical protein